MAARKQVLEQEIAEYLVQRSEEYTACDNYQCFMVGMKSVVSGKLVTSARRQGQSRSYLQRCSHFQPLPVFGTLQRWNIDLIGPLRQTEKGNKYIIVAVDRVNKWPEAGGIPAKTANIIKAWIWENIICRLGTPEKVIGRELEEHSRS